MPRSFWKSKGHEDSWGFTGQHSWLDVGTFSSVQPSREGLRIWFYGCLNKYKALIYHNTGCIYLLCRSGIELDGSVSPKASPAVIHAPRRPAEGGRRRRNPAGSSIDELLPEALF